MGSKGKLIQLDQREHWVRRLNKRLSTLADNGLEPERIARDAAVKKIRARIRDAQGRLRAIAANEKKTEQLIKMKAEKLAVAKQQKGQKKKEAEQAPSTSKRQQKKEKKKEPKGEV